MPVFPLTSGVCCSSVRGGSLQRRVQNVRICYMVCDACKENTRRRNSQSNLWRDSKMQWTAGWTSWPTRLWCYLWRRSLRSDIWWHKSSRTSGCKEFHSVRTQITVWGGHASKFLMAVTVYTRRQSKWTTWAHGGKNVREFEAPGFLPSYGGHVASLEGVGPKLQCRVTPHHSILRFSDATRCHHSFSKREDRP